MSNASLLQLTVAEFLDRLASDTPTPGGGSVAALAGALAAGLGQMVCAFTLGKPKFATVEPQVRTLSERLARAGVMLRALVDEDAAAYEVLSAALKLPKSDAQRTVAVQQAARLAGGVPLETAVLSAKVGRDLEQLSKVANPLLNADAQAAIRLASAAVHAAVANVRANLPLMMADDAREVEKQVRALGPV
jgi:methenyltetrahydrofolate cyclohydrolase